MNHNGQSSVWLILKDEDEETLPFMALWVKVVTFQLRLMEMLAIFPCSLSWWKEGRAHNE